MNRIQAKEKSVRELLSNKYGIDFYQREYVWERRHIEELLDDFEGRFIASHSPQDLRMQVQHYPHYFLGTIVTVTENKQRYIVDGQQRLTTLTLLLIHVHHLRNDSSRVADVKPLIFSQKYQKKSFNIDVPERMICMQALFEHGKFDATGHPDLSVRNLAGRYRDIQGLFPASLKGDALPYFTDWLIKNVDLVEIEAYTGDDAFTIFETMNDRGLNLGQADMLKGYLLANINGYQQKTEANDLWKKRIVEFVNIGTETNTDEVDFFFKTWLRAKYAETIRERREGTKDLDYENIDRFHRWVRDNKKRIELNTAQDFYDFITQQFDRFAGHYIKVRQASYTLSPGIEEIYYNAHLDFTLQYMLALAPLKLSDTSDTVDEKIRLVTTFLDIYLARRIMNFQRIGTTVLPTMFNLTKTIRDMDVSQLQTCLQDELEPRQLALFDITDGLPDGYYMTKANQKHIRYLLTRMTVWIEQGSGEKTNFDNYKCDSEGKPFQIEHIWADNYKHHQGEFDNKYEFQRYRNYLGGLVLLPQGTNQSLGAAVYEDKIQCYLNENLLAASLHPQAYQNSSFKKFMRRNGLCFQPHEQFKKADLYKRQALYRQICEKIWHTDRLLGR